MRARGITTWLLIAVLLAPLVPLALWSFSFGWFFPDLLPSRWTLNAWRYALSDTGGTIQSLWLTTKIAGITALLAVLLGLPLARLLGLGTFRAKALVQVLVMAPIIVPGMAVVLGLHGLFLPLGLTNTTFGVILAHLIPTLPYAVLIMAGVFAGFDIGLEEQARSLGARPLAAFFYVTLPAIAPGLVAAALLSFLVSWGQYALTLVIGGGRVTTLPLLLFSFVSSGRHDIAGAIGTIYILPGLIMMAIAARQIGGRSAAIGTGGA
ncbi:MAG: ABC transporter permease subunit [Rhodobacteraceae bacterium]|nr:ABC transporter permease subunit [Paracoccaceae bacterium]